LNSSRRNLLQSIPALAATGIAVASINEGHLALGEAFELKQGKKYLFVFKAGTLASYEQVMRSLSVLKVEGTIITTYDEPEEALRIYELGESNGKS